MSNATIDTAKHTQGPWRLSANHDSPGEHFVTNHMGWLVAKASGANLSDDPYTDIPGRSDETDANARLIAAAPDLLAACEACVKALEEVDNYDAQAAAEKMAKAAINRVIETGKK